MADNKKYYYIRLKDSFFDGDAIVLLESMTDGYLYSNILLKLYLRSLKDNGKLMFNDRIPYNPQMIATITRHQVGTVEKALKIFEDMGLIEILDNGAIYMLDIQSFIGQSSTEADRKKIYRKKIENERIGQMSGQMSDKRTPEIEIDKDIEKDIDKDIDKEKEKKKKVNTKFKKPTLEEVKEYCLERNNNIDAEYFIDYYNSNGWKVGKNTMKDWKATIRTWEKRNGGKNNVEHRGSTEKDYSQYER